MSTLLSMWEPSAVYEDAAVRDSSAMMDWNYGYLRVGIILSVKLTLYHCVVKISVETVIACQSMLIIHATRSVRYISHGWAWRLVDWLIA